MRARAPDFSRLVYLTRRKRPGALEVLQDAILEWFPKQLARAIDSAREAGASGPTLVLFDARVARERFSPRSSARLVPPFHVVPNFFGEDIRVLGPSTAVIWSTRGEFRPMPGRIRGDVWLRKERRRLEETWTRTALLDWLQWNDPNGAYSDHRARAQGYPPLTKHQAVTLVMREVGGTRQTPEEMRAESQRP